MDTISINRLIGSHPLFKERWEQLDATFTAAIADPTVFLRLTVGLRSAAAQATEYAKGRNLDGTIADPKLVTTNAKPGHSWHQYGFAGDAAIIVNKPGAEAVDWSIKGPRWQKLFEVAATVGLFCGINFKSIAGDDDHFQLIEIPESPTSEDVYDFTEAGSLAVWNRYFPQGATT